MAPDPIDVHKLAAEIEAEVRARRAAGEYPPGFERELDDLFARFAPPEVSTDFESALERSEDLVIVDPVIPVLSRNPAFKLVKRLMARLLTWYHSWLSQQITAIAIAINHAMRLLGARVEELEHVTAEQARARAVGARIPAPRDDAPWTPAVLDALRGCTGRVVVVECGSGELLAALTGAGLDAYGVEPRAVADAALQRGCEVRVDSGAAHLQAVAPGALDAIVLRALVERLALGELLTLVDTAASRLAPGGRLVVCSLQRDAWGRDATAAEADLVPGRPLHPETWQTLLPEQGFRDVRAREAGADAYVVDALRAE
jgi:SAM-dependent methyltransferase